jgi:hypothetical protein
MNSDTIAIMEDSLHYEIYPENIKSQTMMINLHFKYLYYQLLTF